MRVCMCVCMCVYVCVSVCACVCVCVRVRVNYVNICLLCNFYIFNNCDVVNVQLHFNFSDVIIILNLESIYLSIYLSRENNTTTLMLDFCLLAC